VTRRLFVLALLAGATALPAAQAAAAGPPLIEATWVTEVTATSARLRAEINPNGASTTYRFEYITLATYEANVKEAKEPFTGASKVPLSGSANALETEVKQSASKLTPATVYRYRVVATNANGTTPGPERTLGTEEATNAFSLPDGRGWEMVSPADKNGGEIQAPEAIFGGGVFQAAASGQSLTYSSADSFAGGAGAPPGSQYLATRTVGGWSTANITAPLESGGYGDHPEGVPYQLFSTDLQRGLLLNPNRCGEGEVCPRGYSMREGGVFALLAEAPGLRFQGASPDLRHVVLGSPAGLEEWGEGGLEELSAVPGARLAAPSGAISTDGSRIYFIEPEDGPIQLAEAGETTPIAETVGGGASFQAASADGRYAFFLKGAHLYRWDAQSEAASDLTPGGGVQGAPGISEDGSVAYYQDASGLFAWEEGKTTEVAEGPEAAAPSDYPPATGTARVSPDGAHLLFLSMAELSGYENNGEVEVFLYGPPPGSAQPRLTCVSCNPTGERPEGSSSIPGAIANGQALGATRAYKPRALSATGNRVFFDSKDDLAIQDSNKGEQDAYEWEAQGEGGCPREGGCVGLISSGRDGEASSFIDASADGSDAFFRSDASLAFGDPGSYDLYDARVGGGPPPPQGAITCVADACQPLPEAPEDPTPGTLVPNSGNPAPRFTKVGGKAKHKPKHHKHKEHHGRGAKK
jgi:hypothetical protein